MVTWVSKLSPLVWQHVNRKLYTELVTTHLGNQRLSEDSIDVPQLTADEENILRYAAGYVPLKLLKKYEKGSSEFAVAVVECFSAMAVK